ncbi:glycoprotein 3-alpha-L-fucosyltransferase A-like isoform X1 [Rhipicephalus microplus]
MVSGSSLRCQYVAVFLICVSLAVFLFLNNGFPPIAVRLPAWFPESAFTNVTAGEPVTILFWTPTFGSWFEPLSDVSSGLVSYNSCSVPCFLTRNRSLVRTADAVVFHDRDTDARDLPRYRVGHQRWVYWNMEAPPNSRPEQLVRIRSIFNWTYTYRLDSDVPHPYFTIHSRHGDSPQADEGQKPFTVNRSGLVAWVVSNCQTPSHREDFVAELRKHVTVDVYGRCGNLQCPRSEECFAHLGEKYYFYLSLENALCPDYVTEKLYNALSHGMVPVVMGAYSSSLAPPGSCIDALQFASPQRLAAYLKDLAADPARYEAYFDWKKTHEARRHRFMDHCALCEALYGADPDERKRYEDIVEWWHGDRSTCRQWKPPAS